jgi:hypothetical protein
MRIPASTCAVIIKAQSALRFSQSHVPYANLMAGGSNARRLSSGRIPDKTRVNPEVPKVGHRSELAASVDSKSTGQTLNYYSDASIQRVSISTTW